MPAHEARHAAKTDAEGKANARADADGRGADSKLANIISSEGVNRGALGAISGIEIASFGLARASSSQRSACPSRGAALAVRCTFLACIAAASPVHERGPLLWADSVVIVTSVALIGRVETSRRRR